MRCKNKKFEELQNLADKRTALVRVRVDFVSDNEICSFYAL